MLKVCRAQLRRVKNKKLKNKIFARRGWARTKKQSQAHQ
jgi:hypothetical protein